MQAETGQSQKSPPDHRCLYGLGFGGAVHQWESFACHPKHARMELRCWMFVQETEWKQHEQIMVCIGFDGFDPSLYIIYTGIWQWTKLHVDDSLSYFVH